MKIRWVLNLGPQMVSLMEGETVGLLLYNPVTEGQTAEMVGSGFGP